LAIEPTNATPLDFGIERVEKKKNDGIRITEITLNKKGTGIEPVEIVLHEKGGTTVSLLWDGTGASFKSRLFSSRPISIVEIDPKEKTSDRYRANNRDPIAWKWLLDRYGMGYNVNTDVLKYDLGVVFQPVYNATRQVGLGFSHSDELDIGYAQYTKVLQRRQAFTVGLSYQTPQSIQGTTEDPAGIAYLSYTMRYSDIPLLAPYLEWLAGEYPNIRLTLRYDQQFTDGQHDALSRAGLNIRRSLAFSNYHEISAQWQLGVSSGALFKNSRFFLGGETGIRGYTPLRFEGDHLSILSLEYRVPLFYETDINLLGLALSRTVQGALFTSWGNVADGSDLLKSNLFVFSEYKSDVGVGIRWFIDSFGVAPTIFRLDVAWPIDSPIAEEKEPHYYISAGQPF